MALAICLQKKGLHPFECFWLSDGKNCHPPFKQLRLSIPNNCQPRYCSKPLHPSRLRRTWQKIMWIIILLALLLSPHECSRYIFCWIAFFVFIAFDYHYNFFIQDYVIILNKFPEQVMFWPFCMQISNTGNAQSISQSINFACPSCFFTIIVLHHFWDNN